MARARLLACLVTLAMAPSLLAQGPAPWTPDDHRVLRSVTDLHLSPTGTEVVYAMVANDASGRPT